MRGPKPTATHLKVLNGEKDKRKINRREPKPRRTIPRAPVHLTKGAQKLFKAYAKLLHDSGILSRIDWHQLADLCAAEDELLLLRAERDKSAITYEDDRGVVRVNPLIKLTSDLEHRVRMMRADFGMNPSARTRVQVVEPEPDESIERFLT